MNNNRHFVKQLQEDWNIDNTCWTCCVLELTVDPSREEYWTKHYNSDCIGYNTNCGTKHSQETKNKISKIKIGVSLSEAHKQHLSDSHFNRLNGMPNETKSKISSANKGKSKTSVHIIRAMLTKSLKFLNLKSKLNSEEEFRLNLYSRLLDILCDEELEFVQDSLNSYKKRVLDFYSNPYKSINGLSKYTGLDNHTLNNWLSERGV